MHEWVGALRPTPVKSTNQSKAAQGSRREGPTKAREEIEIDFAEIEAIAQGEADLSAAQRAVLGLAERLGLTKVEPRSYLRMYLESRERD